MQEMFRGGAVPGVVSRLRAAKAARPALLAADFALADLDATEGKVDDARKRLSGVVSSHPDNKAAHLLLAVFEMTTGKNPAAAIEQYRKVVALDGNDAMSWNALAYLLAQNRQPVEALKSAQKAKKLAPDSPDVDDTLGWAYYLQGSYPLSVVHLEAAIAKVGTDTAVRKYHLAMAYLKAGKPDRARQTLNAALKMNPNLSEAQAARQAFGIGVK
jgi:Tfp pilus assembly protein PilF